VSRIADAPDGGRFEFPDDSIGLFGLCDQLYAVTGGAVDPLVARDLELLGYDRTTTGRIRSYQRPTLSEPTRTLPG
jgi:thiamine biosynthesis lipoprotein